ncbi:MAG: hypothetical protein BM555_00185 [Crocinitomix sp. MedPE-SWsnd]|nr:MAG: hypothetical protein BM555_00185 [Crocinitomix sp. MedPE-SWsnd]
MKLIFAFIILLSTATFAQDECQYIPTIPSELNIDGDGVDDHFIIEWDCVPQVFEIHIYNRWGMEVFSSETASFKWDGNDSKGNPVADAVVFVILSYEVNGETKSQKTNIALNR